jgi:hypothetical protein
MRWHHWGFLLAAAVSALSVGRTLANVDTTRVRDSTLLSMRRALSHYDVSPCATAAQLALLAQFAEEHSGQPEAEEALFLRAAVASDLAFVAQLKGNADLNAAVAQNFGGDATQLTTRIVQALQEVARGIYREPALLAIKALRESGEQPGAAPGPRSDALLVRRAIAEAKSPQPRERFAALGQDPCATQTEPCSPELAALDTESRKSLSYLSLVAEAEKRLEKSAKLGDQLAEAVVPILQEARRELPQTAVQFLPDPKALAINWLGQTRVAPVGEMRVLVFVSSSELSYATLQQARIGVEATSLENEQPDSAFPSRVKLADVQRQPANVKPVADWVSAFQKLKGGATSWSVGVVPASGTPAHLLARVLLSLVQAGAQSTQLLARTQQGQLTSVPTHVVFAGLREAKQPAELSLRVRMSGYVVRQGESEHELARVTEGGTSRYDLAGLGRALSRRRFQSASLSFVADVTADNLFDALAQLPPSEHPVQMLLRTAL